MSSIMIQNNVVYCYVIIIIIYGKAKRPIHRRGKSGLFTSDTVACSAKIYIGTGSRNKSNTNSMKLMYTNKAL